LPRSRGEATSDRDPLRAFADAVYWANDVIGRTVAWLTLGTVALLAAQVPLRQLPSGMLSTSFNDIGQLVHATVFMVGCAYALRWDAHARVDVFYRGMSERWRAWVNLIGNLLFALPWLGLVGWYSMPIVINAWRDLEIFPDSHVPAFFLLKTLLLVFSVLLGLQVLATTARLIVRLRDGPA
jgi:TRAP-type mannitol/chloroaromatic compound transport system permease small subunit